MTTRVALITGGAQGIGRAIALRLAHDGFDVAVDDTPEKADGLKQVMKEIENLGRKVIMLTEDVAQEDRVKEMVERTVKELGRLDVVCQFVVRFCPLNTWFTRRWSRMQVLGPPNP
jgi:NAD(P)-dependent dehydrogenase (short-subunit alcohol dehydrogenase family)